ncbi:hypothetical protein N0V83_003601 [Neocucurbitaria cava]|uniref:Small ribosomal subunit protein uS7 domain-containing protein n=2 Tax=leotiomyceta TaxID=716546 RepID=A0A9W9CPK6_9PLEO|nr:hypothetical protein N0V83_003601 [Neocucurbitaria cava]
MSPGMPIFPVSPERVAGTKPLYGEPVQMSPSAPNLRSWSPSRHPPHRRNDSEVSVQGLAVMFESLDVKDPREAVKRLKDALDKEKVRSTEKLHKMEKEHARKEKEHEMALGRREVRIEELQSKLEAAEQRNEVGVTREQYEKERKAHKANVAQWEKVFKENEDKWRSTQAKLTESKVHGQAYEQKYREYKKKWMEVNKDALRSGAMIPTLQTKIQGLQRNVQRAESDIKFKTEEAAKYQNQVYSLQIELEGVSARLGEEIQTLKDKLRLIEGERDALKTSLKEEEVMRVAGEGHIALPTASMDEDVEFGSPVRSPRKQHTFQRVDDDKENVSPKKGAVELRFIQQELATEKRLRERAQDQIEFMKMECQFQCCSCRIAENKGKKYVHDDMYAAEMQRIKMSVPALTPPASNHEDDLMDDVIIKQEPVEDERPVTPPSEESMKEEPDDFHAEQNDNNTILVHPQDSDPEAQVTFSPSTGTFRSVPSPVKATTSIHDSTPAKPSPLGFSTVTENVPASSPWTPDAHSTMIPTEVVPAPTLRPEPETEPEAENGVEIEAGPARSDRKENKVADISIHEDAIDDSDEEDFEPPTPSHEPSGPATPYLTRTITTTTTIPLHFSPATPAFKPGRGPMTPSTVAHAAADARTPVLGELSLNKLPFDREAALEAIRERRGRARSMAAGHGTPMKQMVEGVKDRRDISAPVSRVALSGIAWTTTNSTPTSFTFTPTTATMSDGEIEVESPSGYAILPKEVTDEIGSVKLFNKARKPRTLEPHAMLTVCSGPTRSDYIQIRTPVYISHSAGRYAVKRFRKAQCPIIERLTNSLMMNGRNNGKKLMAVRIVAHAFEIIHIMTDQNPIQVAVDAIVNCGPREDSTRIGSAGTVRRQAVDVSPLRRVNQAIALLTIGAREASFRNVKSIAECLAEELINAAKGSSNSYAIKKKDELERVAKSNR